MRILTRMKLLTLVAAAFVAMSLSAFSDTLINFINEGFEGGTMPPSGWSNVKIAGSSTYIWELTTSGAHPSTPPYAGSYYAMFRSWSTSNGKAALTTKPVNLTNTNNNYVSFYMYRDSYSSYLNTADKVEVYVDNDNDYTNGGYTLLGTVNRSTSLSPIVSSGTSGWYNYNFSIPSNYALSSTYIHFLAVSAYGNDMYIDAIKVEGYQPPKPDAAITAMSGLTDPFTAGKDYPITVKIKNANMTDNIPLTSFQINWTIDGVAQAPYMWTGNLSQGSETTVVIGNAQKTYPMNGPYPPITVAATVTNPNGKGVGYIDANSSNDSYSITAYPRMLDAYAVEISRPSGKFSPGTQDVYVRVRNTGLTPLTSFQISWTVDGISQLQKNWSGNILAGQDAEIFLGQVDVKLKQPLAPTVVTATVSNPNVGTDQDLTNNVTPSRLLAPSLLANTFKVGGPGAHFTTFKDAVDYLNAAGILGEGDFTFMVAPGSYNGSSLLGNFGTDRTHFKFIGTSAKASDAFINFESNSANNYVLKLQNINNLEFRNLTFSAQYGTTGTAMEIEKVNNVVFENVSFQGIAAAPKDPMFAVVHMTNSNNVVFNKCNFTNGASALWVTNTDMMTPTLNFTNNTLRNFTANFINFQGGPITPMTESHVVIEGNTMEIISGGNPGYGIMVTDGSIIRSNKISGLRGTGSTDEAAIRVIHNSPAGWATIENNRVTDSRSVNGIYVKGANTKIYRNEIRVVSDLPATQLAGITTVNSNGYVANNISYTSNMAGMRFDNSNAMNVFYNSTLANSTTQAAMDVSGSNRIERNMIIQNGNSAPALNAYGTLVVRENNYWSNANYFASYEGIKYSDIAFWNSARGDNSTNKPVLFDNMNNMLPEIYDPAMQLANPLDIAEDIRYEIEAKDFYGDDRDYFFVGYAIMNLSVDIQSQPTELISCEGAGGQVLAVTAEISNRAETRFQWYKDGKAIPGATNRVLDLDTMRHFKAGLYKALITGPANTSQGVFTDEVAVYSINPTEITKQPEAKMFANLKDTVHLEFESHVRGIVPPFYKDDYQWYRQVGTKITALTDGAKYLGAQTPHLMIRNVASGDYNAANDFYFAIVRGQCGADTTVKITLTKAPTITIAAQPQNQRVCADEDITIPTNVTVSAEATSTTYKWYFNGYLVTNGDGITGADTKDLAIAKINKVRAGDYVLEITAQPGNVVRRTNVATIAVGEKPVITGQPRNIEAVVGQPFSMTILYTSDDNATIKWFKNGTEISGETNFTLTIPTAADADAGTYTARVTNLCGEVVSENIVVVVKPTGKVGFNDIATGANRLLAPTPNPVNGDVANLGWELKEASNVRVALLDATGREIAVLFEGMATAGVTSREFSLSNYNLSSGVYFVAISGARFNATQPLVIVK